MLRTALYVFSFAIACVSCGKKTTHKKQSTAARQSILPSNTGNLSELVLVISDELWAGSAGKVITDVLQEKEQTKMECTIFFQKLLIIRWMKQLPAMQIRLMSKF